MPIDVTPVRSSKELSEFIRLAHRIYEGDRLWVPPLEMDLRGRLDKKKNPFFEHGDADLFLARRDGVVVGRISAQVCSEHERLHADGAGFFGFFESIDDRNVAAALLRAAEDWVRAHGKKSIRGPFNLTINDDWGVLIDGFDTPPMVMMPHNPRYYDALILGSGYAKLKDIYAWKYTVSDVPRRAAKAHADVLAMPEIRIRGVDLENWDQEIRTIIEIFNDAWSENWGFVPLTQAELQKTAKDLKMIIDPAIALVAELDGRPVAVSVAIPNLNEVIADLGGKLLPFGALKLMYRLKFAGPKTARLALLGIRRELRNVRKYAMLSHALYVEMNERGKVRGYTGGELSWTLEDNHPVNAGIRSMGGKVYKTYRGYEKALTLRA